jgi:hypothetical protein
LVVGIVTVALVAVTRTVKVGAVPVAVVVSVALAMLEHTVEIRLSAAAKMAVWREVWHTDAPYLDPFSRQMKSFLRV